jgi:hypothetical protein
MKTTNTKRIHEFKAGDIVSANGAKFRILGDAKESSGHRPMAGHLEQAHGPSDCASAKGEWLEGQIIPGYFGPGMPWLFQGNFLAGKYSVHN